MKIRGPMILSALLTLVMLSVLSESTAAQALRGTIIDRESDDPIANARVLIFRAEGDEIMYGVRSGVDGGFDAAEAIRDGNFQAGERIVINIAARGYRFYEERISLPREPTDDVYRLVAISSTSADARGPRQIWIKALLVEATRRGEGPTVYPEEIEPVVKDLEPLFRFNRYSIIGRAEAMGMEGSEMVFESEPERNSEGRFAVAAEIGFGNGYVALSTLSVHVIEPMHRSINTTLNIPDGEMVILGASRGEATRGSLIVVISATAITSSNPHD